MTGGEAPIAQAAGQGHSGNAVGAVPRETTMSAADVRQRAISTPAGARTISPADIFNAISMPARHDLSASRSRPRTMRLPIAWRASALLRGLGVKREERVLLALLDTIDWPTAFLGCLKAGIIAVPVNTLLTEDDYRFMLADSRAKCLVVSEALFPKFEKLIGQSPISSMSSSRATIRTAIVCSRI